MEHIEIQHDPLCAASGHDACVCAVVAAARADQDREWDEILAAHRLARLEHSPVLLGDTHQAGQCFGPTCTIHRRSHHHLRAYPQVFEEGLMWRICEHGVPHPDPDNPRPGAGDHVFCCGCCGMAVADPGVRAAVARATAQVCAEWGLSDAEASALVDRDPGRAYLVLEIHERLANLYSEPLPAMWMTTPNASPRIGGSPASPVRPVDHAINVDGGLWDVATLLRSYGEGH